VPGLPTGFGPASGEVEPGAPSAPRGFGTGLRSGADAESGSFVAQALRPSAEAGAAAPAEPSRMDRTATPTLALARVEVPSEVAAPRASEGESFALADPLAEGASTPALSDIAPSSGGESVAFAEPTAGLGDILALRDVGRVPMLDTACPRALVAPDAGDDLGLGALGAPREDATPSGGPGARIETGATPEGMELARLPSPDLACVVPPSVTLDVRPAGETDLMINSPCHADSVAEARYHDMRFGVAIDRAGRGRLTMFGFELSAEAELTFADGETLSFSVPFTAVERTERVALVWDAPVALNLHALEFGAEPGSEGHVNADRRRDFDVVRRRGGGYLTVFEPVGGVGQSVQIYSHWVRRGGNSGVVRLYLDFESRDIERREDACGTGAHARPSFTIVRSSRGRIEDPNVRRLGAVDCDDVGKDGLVLIGAAVRDIIIAQR
ncbi:MAG: hypothetical protein ACFBWO_16930, partial [Paracoccaceae bacterium]